MRNKKILIFIALILLGIFAFFFYIFYQNKSEQQVLETTYDISKEYLLLRYRTDNLLVNAKDYSNYSDWNNDMTVLLNDWQTIEQKSEELEKSATKTAEMAMVNYQVVKSVKAYTAKEISNIYDKAPKFKGISTLANHLGVDAKRAQAILNQAQAEITSEVYIEEGEAFETLENTAIVVKDGCKVVGFVGGVVLTGGVAGIATAGTLAQATVVVTGVDLALEVTEDSAQIAFGDRNKTTSFVGGIRTVTEPLANILTITNMPQNLGNAFGNFDSVMFGLEQFRDSAQEGKVIGVDLTKFEYQKPFQRIRQAKYPGSVTVAEMEKAEVEDWLKSLNKKYEPMTLEEVKEFLNSSSNTNKKEVAPSEKESNNKNDSTDETEIGNTAWEGTVESISGGNKEKQKIEFDFVINKDGTVNGNNFKNGNKKGIE
jgi:hypothetical protein